MPGHEALGEQSSGELASTPPTKRASNAQIQAIAITPEIRRHPFLRLQPVQPGAPFLLTREFQTEPRFRHQETRSRLSDTAHFSSWENANAQTTLPNSLNIRCGGESVRSRFRSIDQAQTVINTWLRQYNCIRPHQALGMRPPSQKPCLESGP